MTTVAPIQITDQNPSDQSAPNESCKKCKLATAILTFLTGGGIFLLGIVAIATLPAANWARNSATGIWAGGIISFTGMMGIASSCRPQLKVLKGFYIFLGVSSAILSFIAVIIFAIATIYYAITLDCGLQKSGLLKIIKDKDSCDKKNLAVGVHLTMMLFAAFEFIVSIVGASLTCGCCGCCGQKPDAPVNVIVMQQPQPDVNKTV